MADSIQVERLDDSLDDSGDCNSDPSDEAIAFFYEQASHRGFHQNCNGGWYRRGCSYDEATRVNCIHHVQVKKHSVRTTGRMFSVSPSYVNKVNMFYLADLSFIRARKSSPHSYRLSPELLDVLGAIVKARPLAWLSTYAEALTNILPLNANHNDISEYVVCRALKHLRISRKKVCSVAKEKFTPANMKYYGEYLAAVKEVPNSNMFFYDETHFNRLGK